MHQARLISVIIRIGLIALIVFHTIISSLITVSADGGEIPNYDLDTKNLIDVNSENDVEKQISNNAKLINPVEIDPDGKLNPTESKDETIQTEIDETKSDDTLKDEKEENPNSDTSDQTLVEEITNSMANKIVEENSQREDEFDPDVIEGAELILGTDGIHYYDGKPLYVGGDKSPIITDEMSQLKMVGADNPTPIAIAKIQSLGEKDQKKIKMKLATVFTKTITKIDNLLEIQVAYANNIPRVVNEGRISYGQHFGEYFSIDGYIAFCIQRRISGPVTGTIYNEYVNFDNHFIDDASQKKFIKAMYYGYGGPESIFGDTHLGKLSEAKKDRNLAQGWLITAEILTRLYTGDSKAKNEPKYQELWKIVNDNSITVDPDVAFTKGSDGTDLIVSYSDDKQKTETVTFKSYPKNTVSINVPADVSLVLTKKSDGETVTHVGNKDVTINGGDKFYFEASSNKTLSYDKTFKSTGKLLQPRILKIKDSNIQDLGSLVKIDPPKSLGIKFNFKPNTATVTINHYDLSVGTSHANRILLTEKKTVNINSTYEAKHKAITQLTNKQSGVTYVTHGSSIKETITGDTTINIPYNTQWKLNVQLVDVYDSNKVLKTTYDNVSMNYKGTVKFDYTPSNHHYNNFLVDRTKNREGRQVRYNYMADFSRLPNPDPYSVAKQEFSMPRGNKTIKIPYHPRRNVTVIHKDMDEAKGKGLLKPDEYIKERYENHPDNLTIDQAHKSKATYIDERTGKVYVYQGHKIDYKGSIDPSSTATLKPKKDDHAVEFLFRQQTGVEVIHKDLYSDTLLKTTQTTTGLRTSKKDFTAEKEITKGDKTYVYWGYKINRTGDITPVSTYSHTYDTKDYTIEFLYKLKRDVIVNFLDFYTNKTLIPSIVDTYLQKDTYNYGAPDWLDLTHPTSKYHLYNQTGDKPTGVVETEHLTINFNYKKEINVKVEYKDKRTNQDIQPVKDYKVLQGDKIDEKPPTISYKKNDHRPDFNYRYIESELKGIDRYTNVVAGADDIHITHFYDVPLADVGLKKIQIYTAKAEDGLPVKVELSHIKNYPTSVTDMKNSNKTITLALYQGSNKLDSKKYTAEKIPTNVDFKISPNVLKVNENKPYTVKLEGFDSNDFKVVTSAATITTKGYTSSESLIEVNSSNVTDLSYTGVVMTEREVGKDMKEFYETIDLSFEKLKKMRTGYGFTMPLDMVYNNEIGSGSTDFSFNMLVPESIVDTKYIEYTTVKSNATVPLERTVDQTKVNNETKKVTQKYELQHVNVENRTGAIFSDAQVRANDKRIQYDMVDGERKFYLPIWSRVGQYPITVESADKLGVHQVDIKINYELNIFAHMMAHMDSETIQDDAILFIPIDKKTPFPEGIPEGWTQADVDWIQE